MRYSFLSLLLVVTGSDAFQSRTVSLSGRQSFLSHSVPQYKQSRLYSSTVEESATTTSASTDAKIVASVAPPAPEFSLLDSPAEAFQTLVKKGEANAKASTLKTLVSATLGGCFVGMGGMVALAVSGNMGGVAAANPGLAKLAFALLFPMNLVLALQCGGQLFTGNTANMSAAVWEKKASFKSLLRSWSLSYIGNLIGCVGFALACSYSGVLSGGAANLAAKTLAAKTSLSLGPCFVRAMLCNWLVCLAVYLSMQAKDMTGKYVSILLCISTFVAIGFEHSVANMFLLPAGLLCSTGVTLKTVILKNLLPVTIGNAVSGSLLVGTAFSFMFGKLGENK